MLMKDKKKYPRRGPEIRSRSIGPEERKRRSSKYGLVRGSKQYMNPLKSRT